MTMKINPGYYVQNGHIVQVYAEINIDGNKCTMDFNQPFTDRFMFRSEKWSNELIGMLRLACAALKKDSQITPDIRTALAMFPAMSCA